MKVVHVYLLALVDVEHRLFLLVCIIGVILCLTALVSPLVRTAILHLLAA